MQVPLELAFVNMEPSEFVEARIRERVARLEKHFPRLISCRVAVEMPHHRHQKGNLYHIRIEMGVPQKDLVISRAPGDVAAHFDPYVAINDAFSAAERKLEEYSRVLQGDVKEQSGQLQGRILRMFSDQGYGFIETVDHREIYFHRNSVVDADFDDLEAGQTVELVLVHGESPMGLQATTVRPIRPMQFVPEPGKA